MQHLLDGYDQKLSAESPPKSEGVDPRESNTKVKKMTHALKLSVR
jgi:hypothetical protein